MITFGALGAQICVVGQTDFAVPAGVATFGIAECLARNFPVALRPLEAPRQAEDWHALPNGRRLPVLSAGAAMVASVVCDGTDERAWQSLPASRLVLAWLPRGTTRLPPGCAARLNAVADTVVVPDAPTRALAAAAGVTRPVTVLPAPGGEAEIAALASSVGALIDPAIARFRPCAHPPEPRAAAAIEARLGPRGDAVEGVRRQVCAAYDAGFFSIFNAFMSHLVWQQREDRCHAVLPDWDIDRLIGRMDAGDVIGAARSFCYGQPGDGNLWLKLFQPLFGATAAEMQDERFLWRHAEAPVDRHNEAREPNLTYSRAYELYRSPGFEAVRRQYHRVLSRHVRLHPDHAAAIETFVAAHLDVPIRIAAHVRHPSHTIEQPGGKIARTDAYIERVRHEVRRRGGEPDGDGWAVFVATDQARVLERFCAAFGRRAVFYPDARRTRADEDAAFDALDPAAQHREGHQLQHLVAADRAGWGWRLAWEVVRDAYTMAQCQALLHVVSNVSTAVSYLNPEIDMVFCEA